MKKISINNMILFSIYSAMGRSRKCAFEKIVKECFLLFPEVFGFQSIKKWPDSRKLDRPLRDLKKRKLIEGDCQKGFFLTKSGKESAEGTAKVLGQRSLQI